MTTRPGPTRVSVLRCDGCPHLKLESHGEGDDWYAIASCMQGTRAPRHIGADTATPDWCPLPAPPDPRALLREAHTVLGYFPTHPDTQPLRDRIEAAINTEESK